MYEHVCSTGKHKVRPTLVGTFVADYYFSFILKSTLAKIFQVVCHELLPSKYLMYFIHIVYVHVSICLNKLKYSNKYSGIYSQHMLRIWVHTSMPIV